MDRCLTPPEVARRWGVTPESVLALIRRGALAAFTLSPPGSRRPRWKIAPEAVTAFERSHGPQPAPKPTTRRASRKPSDYVEYV